MTNYWDIDIIIKCIIFITLSGGAIALFYFISSKNIKDTCEAFSNMSYDSQTGTLILQNRSPKNAKVISVVSDYNFDISYKPEQVVYTGATVGGITTGGFHKEGGYNYISGAKRNGRAYLSYRTLDVNTFKKVDKPIRLIQLSNELFEEAKEKNFRISNQFPNSIVVMTVIQKLGRYLSSEYSVELPTLEEAIRIKNFICGE